MTSQVPGNPDLPLMRDEEVIELAPNQDLLTRRHTEEAVRFIDANRDKPFFLYLAHSMPHVPIHASDAFRGKSARGLYGDVIEEIDWSVGQVLGALGRNSLDEDTLVLFTSDNGPWLVKKQDGGTAGPLRDGKGTTFEGGVRERWHFPLAWSYRAGPRRGFARHHAGHPAHVRGTGGDSSAEGTAAGREGYLPLVAAGQEWGSARPVLFQPREAGGHSIR